MPTPRIALVCGHFDPVRDGVADYTRHLARQLRTMGLDVVIYTGEKHASAADSAVGVTKRWNAPGVWRAARSIAQLGADLVHVEFAPSAFGFSRAVGLLPRLLSGRAPVVTTLHEYGVWVGRGIGRRLRSALWSTLERRGYLDRETLLLIHDSAALCVTAEEHQDVIAARFPGQRICAVFTPIGCNIPVHQHDRAQARSLVQDSLGLPPGGRIVVFFGFLHPEKALDRLIAAVAALRTELPELRLILAGGRESHSVPRQAAVQLEDELRHVAYQHGIADRVIFTGYLAGAELSSLLRAADVAVFPLNAGVTSKSGSLLAALAHGVPSIATAAPGDVTGPTEIGAVLRIPPADTAALTAALRLVLTDPAMAERLSRAGLAHAATRTWDAAATTHTRLYETVLTTGTSRANRLVR